MNSLTEEANRQHLLQLSTNPEYLLGSLVEFVRRGIIEKRCIILVAKAKHLISLENRLRDIGLDMFDLTLTNQYIPLNAEKALTDFMIRDMPDENLFLIKINGLLTRARRNHSGIAIFNGMSGLLLEQGNEKASLMLENLWSKVIETEKNLKLICDFPQAVTGMDAFQPLASTHEAIVEAGRLMEQGARLQQTG